MAKNKLVQYKINAPEPAWNEVEKLATRRGISVASLLREGIKWQFFLDDLRRKDGRIFIERKPGEPLTEIVD